MRKVSVTVQYNEEKLSTIKICMEQGERRCGDANVADGEPLFALCREIDSKSEKYQAN